VGRCFGCVMVLFRMVVRLRRVVRRSWRMWLVSGWIIWLFLVFVRNLFGVSSML